MGKDRFQLEQDIMNCWNVVDDLKMLLRLGTANQENVDAVATLYQQKFEALWETFEDCIQDKFGYFPELPNELGSSRKTYGVTEESTEEFEKRQEEEIKNSWSA